jgi:hypothetical protein
MPVEVLTVEANYVGASLDKGLKGAQKELASTAKEAGKLDSTLAKGLTKGSNTAGQSLVNLGRIAQDAPFGFIGIQNNINPLLESFQRLKVETGSTGGALKALAGSLIGAGGLGLAVSVATGLLTVLAQSGFFKAKKGADELTEANKKTKESLDKYNDSVKSNLLDFEKQRTTLQLLVATAISDVSTKEQQASALRRLNELIPDNIGVLTQQNITTQEGTRILREYTKAIEAKGFAELLSGRIAQLSVDVLEKSIDTQKEIALLKEREAKANLELSKITQGLQISNNEFAKEKALRREIADLQGKQIALALKQNNSIIDINKQIERFRSEALKAFQDSAILDVDKTKADATKTVKSVETISDVLAELEKQISFLNKKEIAFNTNESKAKISAFFSTAEKLIKDFNVDPKNTIITKLFGRAADVKIVDTLKILERFSANQFIPPPIEIPLKIIPPLPGESIFSGNEQLLSVPPIQVERFKKEAFLLGQGFNTEFVKGLNDGQLDKAFTELTARIAENQSIVADVIGTFGEGIGKSIAQGGSFISSAFSGILNIIGDFLVKLGRAAILQSKLILAIGAGNPIAGLAAGLAALVAGSILKNIKLPAFATGGTAPGGSILVGERGPEIITAPRGATITPNAQTNAMLSGAGGGTVVFEIQGTKLVGVLNNTNAKLGRNGQG